MALRVGVDAEVVANFVRDVAGVGAVEVDGGFLRVVVERPEELASDVARDPAYGWGRVKAVEWADRPRTFENPGFRVRYAYARAAAVGRRARDLGVEAGPPEGLDRREELALLALLGEMPGWVRQGELGGFLVRLADGFHDVYERCPALPKGGEEPGALHAARVTLAEAARVALGNGLKMIGDTPRERI
ncbi:DALR anticodon-binding domain-containing protein [Actinomadura sp. SCN-SB]|uniref:DALR anticodon-binding domain-containing protein n=1 Tax=Actinomadura sp. SCN-SB TaxID=3373092 RepID=UPI003751C4DA